MNTRQRAVKRYMINELLEFSCFYGVERKKLQRLSYQEVYQYYRLFKLQIHSNKASNKKSLTDLWWGFCFTAYTLKN